MCIITVPKESDREWLRKGLSDRHDSIMTCPIYLFHLLCDRLDCDNENIASIVLSTFEKQDKDMLKSCREVRALVAAERGGRHHHNEDKMYKAHKTAIIQLNTLNIELMTLGCTTGFELSALGFAKSVMARYSKLCAASNPPNNLPRMSDDALQVFDDEIESLQSSTRLRQGTRTYNQDRAQHMVSLVSRLITSVPLIRCSMIYGSVSYTSLPPVPLQLPIDSDHQRSLVRTIPSATWSSARRYLKSLVK